MKVDLFDFDLPATQIALHPVEPRDAARLLVVNNRGALADQRVHDLVDLLNPEDILVVNDTRVIPAELHGIRHRGEFQAKVAFNLHRRVNAATWAAFARPAKRLKAGDRVEFGENQDRACALTALTATVATVASGGEVHLAFDLTGAFLDEAIKAFGAMPLPPYISAKRDFEARDEIDYQTVYADREGAVAAPTAGLHFTEDLLTRLQAKGITIEKLTLHVGAGTFLPVKADDTAEHNMHAEWGEVRADSVARIKTAQANGGRVVAVGTTSLRLLESAADASGELQPFCGETEIFITPGYRFKVVDLLMTNFHLPRSTLFMLVSAFSGLEVMQRAYRHAIENGYRFYSYGDGSLLSRIDP